MNAHPTSRWMNLSTLLRYWPTDLAAQRHVLLQAYLLLIMSTLAGFYVVHGPAEHQTPALIGIASLSLLTLLYKSRVLPFAWTAHAMVATSMGIIYHIILNSGGLASPQMLWLGMVPVPIIFLLGMQATLVWAALVLLSIGLMLGLTMNGQLSVVFQYEREHINWAFITNLCIASNVFFLPLLYHLLNKKQLATIEHRNAELETTRLALVQLESHKDKFMAAVGHELRTPMNAILGFNEVLRQEVQLHAADLETVNHINHSTHKLLKLINQILDFSQLQAGRLQLNMTATDLPELVEHCLHTMRLREVASVPLQLQLLAPLPAWIQTDAQRLKEVLLHLLDNACKFTRHGEVTLRLQTQGDQLLFEVMDTGTGIAADLQTHIFKRFEHADQATLREFGGTGLGLAISKQLIDLFGGTMGLQSELGQGSVFWFAIPMRPCEAPSLNKRLPANTPIDNPAFSMLLVDDNPVNLQVARYMCQSLWPQASIHTADSGPACLRFLEDTPVDLVLMDMFMPEMNGAQTCQAIRRHARPQLQQLPIIGLTASSHPLDKQLCLDAGMNDVIHKPMDKAALQQSVQTLLAVAQA